MLYFPFSLGYIKKGMNLFCKLSNEHSLLFCKKYATVSYLAGVSSAHFEEKNSTSDVSVTIPGYIR